MQEPRPALRFDARDFVDLALSPEIWRWDAVTRRRIQLLAPTRARRVYALLARYVSDRAYELSPTHVQTIGTVSAAAGEQAVRAWLRSLEPDGARLVVVVYGREKVFLTAWRVFCLTWSDFCHPSSNDVVICPLTEEWVLFYCHEDEFTFGQVRERPDG